MTTFLLESGIDTLIHGIFHLKKYHSEGETKDLRFALINIDNAIELLLKKSLLDIGIDIMTSNYRTKSILDNLKEIRKIIEGSSLSKTVKKELEPFINHFKIITFHKDRNEAYHVGSIKKEEQLIELTNDILKSIQSFIKAFFDMNVNQLDSYLSGLMLIVYPLDVKYNQLNDKRGKITDQVYLQQSYELLKSIIIYCFNHIFGAKDSYTNTDLETAIDKLKQMKEFEHTFLEGMAPTIKNKFTRIRDINELVIAKIQIDDEIIKDTFFDLSSTFSFFLEIYRFVEMGYIEKRN